ncbi:hypothetical protein B0H34DRAFT_689143 [Crassisporium funariophilum]|nr:hypothetical protein B0H34DRAFT_689143 [Crassisporium funariophilum]
MAETEKNLLSILQAHGQQFLQSFPSIESSESRMKRKRSKSDGRTAQKKQKTVEDSDDEDYEEWTGINSSQSIQKLLQEDEEVIKHGNGVNDDNDLIAQTSRDRVVVFSDINSKPRENDAVSRAQMKAFMSSKVTKVLSDDPNTSTTQKTQADEEEDKTNAQNDALLHKLVHTKLLSGSLDYELDLTPAQRRKALAGRVLELSGEAKLGKGEKSVREAERNKASKRVREGIAGRQKERGVQKLEEAKNLGNYHPVLKRVFEASSSTPPVRKREKGLKMGVGKFSNGSLRLSREDIDIGIGGQRRGSSHSRGGSRGSSRGNGRGKSGKRK